MDDDRYKDHTSLKDKMSFVLTDESGDIKQSSEDVENAAGEENGE